MVTTVAMERQYVLHILSVQRAVHMCRTVMCGLSGLYSVFPCYS
jgi:hypothetical protein